MSAGAPADNHTGTQWSGPRANARDACNNGAWIFVIGLVSMYDQFNPTYPMIRLRTAPIASAGGRVNGKASSLVPIEMRFITQ